MEQPKEVKFSWPPRPMEEPPDLVWFPMEQLELPSAPVEQKDTGRQGLLADQQFRLASAAAIGLQIKDNPAYADDTMILQLLEEPRDERDLDGWISGNLYSSPLHETNVDNQMKGMRSCLGGTRSFCSKKRGPRKKRMSLWRPWFFERGHSPSVSRVCTQRKNNSHWTQEEVNLLVEGISKYGIGRWVELKEKYFKQSIRTSVNLKDKWRNLLKAYDVELTSKTNKKKLQQKILLHLDQQLIKRIRELAEKHR